MLLELRVENLLLIERAELRLSDGLNVITGETGAGKTMLADALDLLLGGRPRAGIVRPGAAEAWVEGVLELPDALREALGDRIAPDAQELVLARRVGADGRTRAYMGGRSATVADLREAGEALLAFYGQHEHRKLTLASAQLELLDAFCGDAQAARRAEHAAAHARARALRARQTELAELAGARERELDLLRYELAEIDAAAPQELEREVLGAERERLRHQEALRTGALSAAEALAPSDSASGAVALLAGAERALDGAAGVDGALDALAERVRALRYEADDLAGELHRYPDTVEAAPGRLEEVEERLTLLGRLERKHGGSIGSVLAHAVACRARIDELEGADVALGRLDGELAEVDARRGALALELRAARAAAAPELARAVRSALSELAMEGASFAVELEPRERPGPAGEDAVEFLIAANPGVPAGPLRDVASGGETSRTMLALLSVARPAGDARALVFDEIDAGIGGVTARAVGAKLRALAAGRRVLCITHLPQIASLADRHFVISKDASCEPARTTVTAVEGDGVVAELARMLGSAGDGSAARAHARELLRAA